MKSHKAILAAMLLAVMYAGTDRARAAGVSKEQLLALAKELEAQGGKWLKGEPVSQELAKKLKEVQYDKESLTALRSILGARRGGPVSLYVANHLLKPLLRGDKEIVARALPTVKKLHARLGRYQQFPKYAEVALARYKMPPFNEREPAEVTMRKIALVDRARREKIGRERAIALHNEQVYELELSFLRLMLLADDTEEDKRVIAKLTAEENRGSYLYVGIIDTIVESAGTMSTARAKYFYDELKKLGERLRWERKEYIHLGRPLLNPAGNSDFARKTDYPGRLLLKAVNKLAAKAQMPEVHVPSNQEINRHIDQRRRKARR